MNSAPSPSLLILTAVTVETEAVRRAVADLSRPPCVSTIGIRAGRLPPDRSGASLIILAGLAGALDPSLGIGEVVVDDPAGTVPPSLSLRRGRIHTADQIIATAAEKAELFGRTGAAAVEMEQAIVARWAEQQGAAWIGVRAVSDTAAEALDPAFVSFVDNLGRPKPAAIAMGLLRRPALVGQLRRLEQNSKLALQRLAAAVRQIVLAIEAGPG